MELLKSGFSGRLFAFDPAASARNIAGIKLKGQRMGATQAARRFLLVDDREDVAESLARVFRFDGHEARVAMDGAEGFALAAKPEVVLLEIGLPKMHGYEVARRIREQPWGKTIVLIALTGFDQEENVRRSRETGFDHHLLKPIKSETLCELVPRCFPTDQSPKSWLEKDDVWLR